MYPLLLYGGVGDQGEGELFRLITIWRAVWAYVGGSNWVIAHPRSSKGGSMYSVG